jgi:hypothetical protein
VTLPFRPLPGTWPWSILGCGTWPWSILGCATRPASGISQLFRALMGFPFEPMDKVRLKYLTFKTVFWWLWPLPKDGRSSMHLPLPRRWLGNPRICPRIPGKDPGS